MGRQSFIRVLQAVAIAAVLACAGPVAHAQVTWTGTTSSFLWSDTSNWSTLLQPPSGAFLFFSSGASANTTSNNDLSGLSLSGLTFLDNTFTGPLTLSGNALTLSATTTTGASFLRTTGSTVTVTQANHGLVTGQFVNFTSSQANYNTIAQVTVVNSGTFTYTGISTGVVPGVTGTYTPATINNLNTTANRNVTIANNLTVSNAQVWASAASANAITTISGSLSGSGNLTIAGGVASNTTSQQPNFRLTGNNSSYTGTISLSGGTNGVLLGGANAMTGGLIDIRGAQQNLWLTANSGTYTFGIGGADNSGARVLFGPVSNGRSAGILLTGGDVHWNPGGGADYDWSGPAGTNSAGSTGGNIQVRGGVDPTTSLPYRLFLGREGGTFTISGGDKNIGGGGNSVVGVGLDGRVKLLSALGSGTDTTAAQTLEVSVPVLTLSAAAVRQSGTLNVNVGAVGNSGNGAINGSGLEISNVNQLPNGNLTLGSRWNSSGLAVESQGVLILNNMGSTFNRPYGTGTGQWQITGPNSSGTANWAGFAATGADATITIPTGSGTSSTSVFDRNFALGYSLRNPNGTLYADKGVTIAQDTTLTDTRLVSVANNGMNFYGLSGSNTLRASNVLNELSGNLSGTGALVVLGQVTETNATQNDRGILVLSGSNSWTGAPVSSLALGAASVYFNAGPGGLIAQQSFVRFARPESLPTGASSGTSYLVAVENGRAAGLLVTGGTATQTYDLSGNYRFLLGSNRGASTAANALTSFGADGGKATVKGSSLLLNGTASTHAMGSSFIVLNGSELRLGTGTSNAEAFNLIPSSGFSTTAGTSGTYADATGTRSLFKFGEGTLVLGNVRYTDLALSGTDKSSQFAWQIGSGNAAPWLDGAVRGLSMSAAGANKSNSLQGFYVAFAGGVYEVDNTQGTSGTLDATLATSASGTNTRLNLNGTGGGGFSAFGGNVQVNLNSGTSLTWNSTTGFAGNNIPLLFGSQTADAVVTLTNNISLNTSGTREIRVFDNSATSSDYAVLSGTLSSSANLNKTGPGILRLSNTANTYSGQTTIASGVLEAVTLADSGVNSSIGAATGTNATIILGSSTTSGRLSYVGAGLASTNRSFNLAGNGGIEANGGNALTITGTVTGAGTQVFTLSGTSTALNSLSSITGGSGVSVTKTGPGTWQLTGQSTYTGNTLIESGTLVIGANNAISGSSAITIGTAGSRGSLKIDHALSISSLTFTGQGGDIVDPSAGTATFSSTTGTAVISVLGGTNAFHADATLSSPTVVNVVDGALFTFHNNISGSSSSSLTKSGSGIMQIVGDNEGFSGNFFITGGRVNIGAGMNQIGTGTITLSNGSLLDLNGQLFTNFIDSSGGTILNPGAAATTITGPTLVSSTAALLGTYEITSTGSARFEGVVGNGSSLVTVRVNTGTGTGGRAVFANAVTGSANITVESGGLATFGSTVSGYVISHGTSAFNGNLLSGGEVQVNNGGSAVFAGTTGSSSTVSVAAGGAAEFRSTVGSITAVTGSALFTSAAGLTGSLETKSGGVATLDDVVGSAITGQIHNDGTLNIVRSTGSETISAVIDGSGSLVKQGAGLVALTGNNSPFGGVTTISGGTLSIGNGGESGSFGGSITNNAALVFNRSNASTFAGTISGSGSLTKRGGGKLTLTGNNNALSGLTTVEQGSLAVNGLLGPGGLSVLAGATLMGSGTIGGDATIAGTHSPGNSPGITPFSSNLTYTGGLSQVIWELWDNTDDAGSRGTSYDGIDVTGTLNFDGATSLILSFGGSGTGSVNWGNSFWAESQEWLLYSVSGTTTNFNNFTLSSNPSSWIDSTGTSFASSTRSGGSFQVVQQGSNILLQYVVVPEPAAITLALIGIAASVYVAARRRS